MKFGFRMPSLKKRVAARTSAKRFLRHNLGLKAPRGFGWLTNPKKALYNRIYNRTTFGIGDVARGLKKGGCLVLLAGGTFWFIVAEIVRTAFGK